jgi:predicted dehydrogenase
MDRIRIGVVGVGHLGNYHLQKYQKFPNVKIVGVSDLVPGRAAEAASVYSCEAFNDHADLIDLVDAVSIAVPTASHYRVARDFLAAGVDVLLEKPTASTVAEARELNDLARAKELILQIGFVERFNPAIIALEKVIDCPLFIEAHRLHPFFSRGTDVDVILDLMIHDLDIILKFVDSPLEDVAAVGVSVLSPEVDIANARLSFANGCVANVTASRVTGKSMQKIRFFGLNGYHAIDYAKRELISLSKNSQAGTQHDIVQNPVEVKSHDPLAGSHRHAPLVSGVDALPALEAAAKITEKIRARAGIMPLHDQPCDR